MTKMLLSECPENVAYLCEWAGHQLPRYRKGNNTFAANLEGKLSEFHLPVPPSAYRVIKKLFREDGDE